MKKVVRLTESDLTRIVKKIIVEQRDMKNEQIIISCYPKKLLKYDSQSGGYFTPNNNLLDELEEATSSFDSEGFSNWDEERIVKALERSTKENANLVQEVLKCALPKMNFKKLYNNNPLLTICRIAFTNSMGVDFGDSRLKIRAQKALNRLGINVEI